jgi:hypothetical protein
VGCAAEDRLRLVSLKDSKPEKEICGIRGDLVAMAVSSDRRDLAIASDAGQVQIMRDGQVMRTYEIGSQIRDDTSDVILSMSGSGNAVLLAKGDRFHVIDP